MKGILWTRLTADHPAALWVHPRGKCTTRRTASRTVRLLRPYCRARRVDRDWSFVASSLSITSRPSTDTSLRTLEAVKINAGSVVSM